MENPIDIDKITETLEPDTTGGGGLQLPGKDWVVFRPPERKSLLGLDALASAKRAEGSFKVDREKVSSMMSSLDDEVEKTTSSVTGLDEDGSGVSSSGRNYTSRQYRDSSGSKTFGSEIQITEEEGVPRHGSSSNTRSEDVTPSSRSCKSHRNDSTDYDRRRSDSRDDRGSSRRYYSSDRDERDHHVDYGKDYRDYGNKRSRYESSSSGRSDWDDGRWEWEDSRHRQTSRSPMLLGASPDARLVSPWLGGNNTPMASPWDSVAPSPVPIRASGSENPLPLDDGEDGNTEISESMQRVMEYNSDRAWYDSEEGGNTMFDADSSSFYLEKKEAQVRKRLVRKDGTPMTLAQSKKLSQLTADNAQWEDRQHMRSGAVRGTEEVQTEFDDEEDERKVILLVHDTKPPFLDGRIVFTKQAEPIMPLKDPTSDMAIISRKGSNLVREVHEKQSMNKSRQRFWELAGSNLGNILGVEKTAQQIDADTALVGQDGQVDFKEEAKFGKHMIKGDTGESSGGGCR